MVSTKASDKPSVAILMGSDSDWPVMKEARDALADLGIGCEARVLSAHRTPKETAAYVEGLKGRGIRVVIAGAGLAAHLPGVVAAFTCLPVIGVPIPAGPLQGQDALYAIVQMPKGIPVSTVAIGGAANAGILAGQMLSIGDERIYTALEEQRRKNREKILAKKLD